MTTISFLQTLLVATTNRGKLAELTSLLNATPISIKCLDDFPEVPDAVESGESFIENARLKAQHYSRLLNQWVLADDSGLAIDALDGAPGVYSSRFSGLDLATPAQRDQANIEKVLELLANVPQDKRHGRFCCALCLCDPQAEVQIEVEGFMEGVIIDDLRGENGFGYDPIFYLPDHDKTAAQLSTQEKNQRSHRSQALSRLLVELNATALRATQGK